MTRGLYRRATSVLLSLLFLSSTTLSVVAGATPEDITAEGDLSEWSADTLMGTDANGVGLHLTDCCHHLGHKWSVSAL